MLFWIHRDIWTPPGSRGMNLLPKVTANIADSQVTFGKHCSWESRNLNNNWSRINAHLVGTLANWAVFAAFAAFYCRWISVIDPFVYLIVDCCWKLAAKVMCDKSLNVQSQLYHIWTQSPWFFGLRDSTHGYLHNIISRLFLQNGYCVGSDCELFLPDVEKGSNFAQHNKSSLPHYYRFKIMPWIPRPLDLSSILLKRIIMVKIACNEKGKMPCIWVYVTCSQHESQTHCYYTIVTMNEKVWFHTSCFE